ncbi:MAG: MBL fold metallo-hydrolase [Candidatus Riflebacteria bacterium]|nr:MBL fold metallo-hydrolase [Candidatus Riflebacteria bacterium]
MLAVTFLGSGSKGNAALMLIGKNAYLLDAGLSCRRIEQMLAVHGRSLTDISGIFLSHDHGDHTRGLKTLLKKCSAPVYATAGTAAAISHTGIKPRSIITLKPEHELEMAGTRIFPFRVPHDAAEPIGLRFEKSGRVLGIATDLGSITSPVLHHLADCDILCIESNYDDELLEECSYPDWLKNRIRGPLGHLPNPGVRGILSRLKRPLEHLLLVHVSEESNTPDLVRANLEPLAGSASLARTSITVASQDDPTPLVVCGPLKFRQGYLFPTEDVIRADV